MILIQFLITDRFLSHKKSILSIHIVSSVGQSYWLTKVWSSSLIYCVGVYVVTFSGEMITQHAWTHSCLIFHSSLEPKSIACLILSSELYILLSSSFSSCILMASARDFLSGMIADIWLDLSKGTHNVLAASLKAALLAICINVPIEDTLSAQYFCCTYSITLNLCTSSKSISKSGILIRAGLRNLSNSSA